jgi:hypothetical protein
VKADGDSVAAFAGWCVVGAAGAFAVISLLTVGPLVLLVTLILAGVLLWRVDFGWAMAGMITGAGVPVLFLAWLNRGGPGEVCTRTATELSCTDEYSPWAFLVGGVLLLVAGVAVFVLRRGR